MANRQQQEGKENSYGFSEKEALIFLSVKHIVIILLGGLGVIFLLYKALNLIPPKIMDARFTPSHQIRLDDQSSRSGANQPFHNKINKLPLRVAVAPVISPEKSLILYQDLVDYLGRALDRESVMIQRSSYGEINDLVRYGRCDVAFVCTYAFVLGEREFGMEILAAPQVEGKITYQSYIIVPASSPADSLLDLRGKRFGGSDILSNTGWLFPTCWLKSRDEDPERFFSERIITGSHDRSVLSVVSGYVDGAAVDSLVYDQMKDEDLSISGKTRIILESPHFGNPPVVVHPHIDPALKTQLRDVLLKMHEDPEGKKALKLLKIDRFVVPDGQLYDEVREMADIQESSQ